MTNLETRYKEFMEHVAPILMTLPTDQAVEIDNIIKDFFRVFVYSSFDEGWNRCHAKIRNAVQGPFRLDDYYSSPSPDDRHEFMQRLMPQIGILK